MAQGIRHATSNPTLATTCLTRAMIYSHFTGHRACRHLKTLAPEETASRVPGAGTRVYRVFSGFPTIV